MTTKNFDLKMPFPDVFPEVFADAIGKRDFLEFRNFDHFRFVVSKLTQKEDNKCGMTYATALEKLLKGESDFPETQQEEVRDQVRNNLWRRGLITEEIYEAYRYTVDGTTVAVDVGKFANGEPDCVMSPAREYVDFFYELYISVSYPYHITNEKIRENIAKILATIEELERQHIFIKITLVLPIESAKKGGGNFFSAIPLFSHKDHKSVSVMSAVINDRLLRKFYFAILEDLYEKELHYNYGFAVDMKGALNVGGDFDEVRFFESIVEAVGA